MPGSKTMCALYYFNFEWSHDVLKSKSACILLNKNIKTKRNRKIKISHTVLERRTLSFSSYKNRKLKVKLMSWSLRKKKEGIIFFQRMFY